MLRFRPIVQRFVAAPRLFQKRSLVAVQYLKRPTSLWSQQRFFSSGDKKFEDIPEAVSEAVDDLEDNVQHEETSSTVEVPAESPVGSTETLTFQAETRKILDIVAHSLYTDKDVNALEVVVDRTGTLTFGS